MGRWGDGLFEGDNDCDAISEMFEPDMVKGLKKDVIRLRLKAWEQDQLNKKPGEGNDGTKDGSDQIDKKPSKKPSKKELAEDWEYDVGLHNPRFPRLVRNYLNSGVLAVLVDFYGPKKANSRWSHGHKALVLIAYCAMELGCTLPPGFLARLKSNYHRVGLLEGETEQMRRACDEYVDGKPYEFVSLGLVETMMLSQDGDTQRPEPRPPGLEPLHSPEAAAADEQPAPKRRKVEPKAASALPVEEYCLYFPPDTCANCGATRGHGTPDLKRCKGCKTALYCFEGCQKWHWFRHRGHCALEQEDEESVKGESIDKGGDVSKEETQKATA